MFSLLKRCKYSLYSDTMLHFLSQQTLVEYTQGVSNETNEDVRMYIEEFILVDIWIHCCTKSNMELDTELHWKCCSLYTLATKG